MILVRLDRPTLVAGVAALLVALAALVVGAEGEARAEGLASPAATSSAEAQSAQLGLPEGASEAGAFEGGDARAVAHLVLDAESIRAGDPFRVGVGFTLDPEWHVYWRNPGDSGMEPYVEWQGDVTVAPEIAWPTPLAFDAGPLVTYGYGGRVILSQAAVANEVADGVVELVVDVDYLACDPGGCIPHRSVLRRVVPSGAPAALESERAWFRALDFPARPDAALDLVPREPQRDAPLRLAFDVCTDAACPSASELGALRFLPDRESLIDPDATLLVEREGGWLAVVEGRATRFVDAERIRGVLVSEAGPAWEIDVARADAVDLLEGAPPAVLRSGERASRDVAPASAEATTPPLSLWSVLLLALLGGALLNLMPCVLPVLAIKVAGFASVAHQSRRHIAWHGAAYLGGVVATMAALAGVVIALRSVGVAVGWGFQFQSPAFLLGLVLLLTVFAANLFGAWEVPLGAGRLDETRAHTAGLLRSALEGVLAVVVATPCSAPFLGAAVGAAFAAPAMVVLATFVAIGVGLAAPFVLLTLVPGAARLVPRPGAWMLHLKSALGFALLATVVWLLSVVGSAFGADASTHALALAVAAGFAAWVLGRAQVSAWRGAAWAIALASVLALGALSRPVLTWSADVEALADAEGAWAPWSEAAVSDALREGRPVFVDFTAEWCISCKVNKRTVLESEPVAAAFGSAGVQRLLADWTHRDDTIREVLARHGRAGVPLYLLYHPDRPDAPEVLPELLTREIVLDAIARVSEPAPE